MSKQENCDCVLAVEHSCRLMRFGIYKRFKIWECNEKGVSPYTGEERGNL